MKQSDFSILNTASVLLTKIGSGSADADFARAGLLAVKAALGKRREQERLRLEEQRRQAEERRRKEAEQQAAPADKAQEILTAINEWDGPVP